MKGQFFVISAVIIVLAVFSIYQILSDFEKIDFRKLEEMREPEILMQVKDSLENTAKASISLDPECRLLNEDLTRTEEKLKKWLAENGIIFEYDNKINCPNVEIDFNLTSIDFSSQTSIEVSG